MLPNAKAHPADAPEMGIYRPIPLQISCDLGGPVLGMGFWRFVVLGASMPVATVNENGDTRLTKDDIGRASMGWIGAGVHPVTQP